jgi:putative ABC transport system ATP-binding protein
MSGVQGGASMEATASLRAQGLAVTYGPLVALRDVTVDVAPGSLVAVTGPSGAGKTSLLWALAGAVAPAEGTVHLGRTLVRDRVHAAALGIAIVPQGNGLATTLTARENILVPLLAAGVAASEAAARTEEVLAVVGLEESGGHLPEELSGGQQQRVSVARALAARGRVLLADEPTSDLDALNRQRVIAALRSEADGGAVVVMSTNDPEAADQTDAELSLDEGRMRWVRS